MNFVETFLQIDLPAILAAIFVCVSCGIVGNFLVLRKQSSMSDSLAHSVLPGIVLGFIAAGTRSALPLFTGALLSALCAAYFIERIRQRTILDNGSIMAVVYTSFFALGIFLISQGETKKIDLDLDCVLFGQIEYIFWVGPQKWRDLLRPEIWGYFPREIITLAFICLFICSFVLRFWNELKFTSFDPLWSQTIGIPVKKYDYGLILMIALAIIASFEAVGSMVVVALIICPAAAAKILSRSFPAQFRFCIFFSLVSAICGYIFAAMAPSVFHLAHALSASGMIATMSGLVFVICFFVRKMSWKEV